MSDYDKTTMIGQKHVARPAVTKGAALNIAQRSGTAIETNVKGRGQARGPANHGLLGKLDDNDAPKPPPTVGMVVGRALSEARLKKIKPDGKAMTQKDLAVAANCKPSDIADIESGKAKPDQVLLGKLERIVGVKLRGAEGGIGQPLHGPKKK